MKQIDQDYLKSILHYNPETGWFAWTGIGNINGKRKKENRAGYITLRNKYRQIQLDGQAYLEHKLAFLYMKGWMPDEIDHENLNGTDNRWKNLREATRSQNQGNTSIRKDNTLGYKGITWNKRMRKYVARVQCNKKRIHALFDSIEEAVRWRQLKAEELHGEFAR